MTLSAFFKSIPCPNREGADSQPSQHATEPVTKTVPVSAASTEGATALFLQPELPVSPAPTLYVSTCLEYHLFEDVNHLGRDLMLNDVVYRRLDPPYYCWLRYQMRRIAIAHRQGEVSDECYVDALTPFMAIKAHAVEAFGETQIQQVWNNLFPKLNRYVPPSRKAFEESGAVERKRTWEMKRASPGDIDSGFNWPSDDARQFPFRTAVTDAALVKVQRVESEALSKGWTKDQLYQNRGCLAFPFGKEYGLVCFLKDEQHEVGNISEVEIEVVVNTPHGQRKQLFQRPST